MIIAKDIIKGVIENDEKCIEFIFTSAKESDVLVPFSCILWGLEMADDASASGIHALAKLISISEITAIHEDYDGSDELPYIKLTPDALLSCLFGIVNIADKRFYKQTKEKESRPMNKNNQPVDFLFCTHCMQPVVNQSIKGFCPHCKRRICLECG